MVVNGAVAIVLSLFFYVFILVGAELLRVWFRLSPLMVRRLTILGLAHSVLVLPALFRDWHWFAVAPAIFSLIYLVGGGGRGFAQRKKGIFGAVYVFLGIIFLFNLFWQQDRQVYAIAGILVMGWGDTLAALMGRYWGRHTFYIYDEEKSWEGTLGMFAGSWGVLALVASGMMGISGQELVAYVTLTSAFAALLEAVSIRGTDNFIVPVGTAFFLFYLIQTNIPSAQISMLVTGVVGSFALALIAYWMRALDEGGVAGTILVGSFTYTFGGWNWIPALVVFFVSSSALTRWSRRRKPEEVEDKGQTRRGVDQVLANGGIAVVLATLSFLNIFEPHLLFVGFLGSLAGVTADTWATEIGLALGGKPRHIFSGKEVPPGTSGGVTAKGFRGAFMGSMSIALTSVLLSIIGGLNWQISTLTFAAILVSGVAGAIIDSLIGATLQVQYYCDYCLKYTEQSIHRCGCRTKPVKGLRWLDNNWVNFFTSAASALLAMAIYGLSL